MQDRPIRFRFNAKKAAQAACRLLVHSGSKRNYMELVKLLYLADREALLRLQCQITGDQLAALPLGPVVSHILDLIRWGPANEEDAPWFEAISAPIGYDVQVVGECGNDDLSGAECQILDEIFAKYGKMDWKALSRFTHTLPEWVDPNGSRIPISAEQILKLEGKTQEEIQHIRDEISAFECLDRELSVYQGQEFEVPSEQAMAG